MLDIRNTNNKSLQSYSEWLDGRRDLPSNNFNLLNRFVVSISDACYEQSAIEDSIIEKMHTHPERLQIKGEVYPEFVEIGVKTGNIDERLSIAITGSEEGAVYLCYTEATTFCDQQSLIQYKLASNFSEFLHKLGSNEFIDWDSYWSYLE